MRKAMCILVLAIGLACPAALAQDPTAMPYAEVQSTQLPGGDWEYVYDVYGNGGSWFTGMDLSGFDGEAIVNQFGPVGYSGVEGTLLQKWDYLAANNPASWDRYVYGSYSDDGATWTLHGDVWSIDNPWHAPSEYVGIGSYFIAPSMLYPGQVSGTGCSFGSKVQTGGLLNGLIFTFRLVHPNAPGVVTFHSYSYNNGGQHVYQDLLGPGSDEPVLGDFDGDGDADPDDVDLLCNNMGGDPVTYDMDGDLDVDEDDMIFHVENYLEYDSDGDGVADGAGTFRGDFNTDGSVNGTDLSIMNGGFGTAVGFAGGNANCDATVNGTDLSILAGVFGNVATAAVPEPLTIGLLSLSGVVLLRRRK